MKNVLSKIFEFLPAFCFVYFFILFDIKIAIAALVYSTIISFPGYYLVTKKISGIYLFTNIMVVIFGGLSMLSDNPVFIKLKPTVINLVWAFILILDLFILKKGFLKKILGHIIPLPEEGWKTLTSVWIIFFIFLAFLNEIVWRNFSEAEWVYFKIFGLSLILLTFATSSVFYMHKKYNKS